MQWLPHVRQNLPWVFIWPDSRKSKSLRPVVSTLAWGLGYFGMPHILLRFMAIDDPNKLKTSRRVASVWVVISMGMAVLSLLLEQQLAQKMALMPAVALTVMAAVPIYVVLLLVFHALEAEDVRPFPGGDRMIRFLRLKE